MKKTVLSLTLALAVTGLWNLGGGHPITVNAAETESESVTVTDLADREVTVNLPVENAYLGYYYENFLAVVGEDAFTRVGATSLYDTEGYANTLSDVYRENVDGYTDMVDVGSVFQDNFDVEKLIELDCDVAIMAPYQMNSLGDKVELLEKAGIPVVIIDYATATEETHVASTEILGKIFQVEDRAQEIIDTYVSGHENVKKRLSEITDKKTTFHEYHSMISSYTEIGGSDLGSSLLGRYLSEAGAEDLAATLEPENEGGSGITLDIEYILEQDPDAWIIVGGESKGDDKDGIHMGYHVTEESLLDSATGMIDARPGWSNLQAVKNKQIFCIENNMLRTLRDYIVVEYIAKWLYPEEMADVDPDADMMAFSEKYLPSLPTDGIFFYQYIPE